jgi:hypothetical protein
MRTWGRTLESHRLRRLHDSLERELLDWAKDVGNRLNGYHCQDQGAEETRKALADLIKRLENWRKTA